MAILILLDGACLVMIYFPFWENGLLGVWEKKTREIVSENPNCNFVLASATVDTLFYHSCALLGNAGIFRDWFLECHFPSNGM